MNFPPNQVGAYYSIIIDDAKKISRLNAPNFNRLVVAWKAWKEKDT